MVGNDSDEEEVDVPINISRICLMTFSMRLKLIRKSRLKVKRMSMLTSMSIPTKMWQRKKSMISRICLPIYDPFIKAIIICNIIHSCSYE